MRTTAKVLPAVCLLGLMNGATGGCFIIGKTHAEKHYHLLAATRGGTAGAAEGAPALRVRRFRIAAPYSGKALVYRTGDTTYAADFYNEFFAPPEQVITEQVLRWMADSGLFSHVIDAGGGLDTPYVLDGAVNALFGDFREGRVPSALLEMQFFLLDDSGARTRIVARHNYTREVRCGSQSGHELVLAWNAALTSVLEEFEEAVRGAGVLEAQAAD